MSINDDDDKQALAPDELVDHIVELLAYNGNLGAAISDILEWATEKVGPMDDFQKDLLWQWLAQREDEVTIADGLRGLSRSQYSGTSFLDMLAKFPDLRLFATEDLQWTTLSGKPKEGNIIGARAFELLCLISSSRTRGVTNLEMSKKSGQDPRSFHGRISLLLELGLIQRYPIVSETFNTYLNVYHKFVQQQKESGGFKGDFGINVQELRRSIVDAVKLAKNGLRPIFDLKVELGFNKQNRQQRFFSLQIRKLEAQGYIKRVIATMKGSKTIRAKCIKFIQDLPQEDKDSSESESEMSENEEFLEGEADEDSSETPGDTSLDLGLLEESSGLGDELKTQADQTSTATNCVLFNTFFPIEVQIMDAIAKSGTDGISVKDICQSITGISYLRILPRILDQFVDNGKKGNKFSVPVNLKNLEIIRGTDFAARIKYFRYFTRTTYHEYSGKPLDPAWGGNGPYRPAKVNSLYDLNEKHRSSLPGFIYIFRDTAGKEFVVFHGDTATAALIDAEQVTPTTAVILPSGIIPKKRGRPRKNPATSPLTEGTSLLEGGSSPGISTKRGRGRPRKHPKVEDEAVVSNSTMNSGLISDASASHSTIIPEDNKTNGIDSSESKARQLKELLEEKERKVQEREHERIRKHELKRARIEEEKLLVDERRLEQQRLLARQVQGDFLNDAHRQVSFPRMDSQDENYSLPIKLESVETGSNNAKESLHDNLLNEETAIIPALQISFAAEKRENLIISALTENGGVYEGGNALLSLLRVNGSENIDRRTMLRSIDAMMRRGKIIKNIYKVQTDRGTSVDKYFLTLPSVDVDSPQIASCKDRLKSSVERKNLKGITFQHPVSTLESEFQYYFLTDKNKKLDRAIARLSKPEKVSKQPRVSAITGTVTRSGGYGSHDTPADNTSRRKFKKLFDTSSKTEIGQSAGKDQFKLVNRKRMSSNSAEQDLFYRIVIIARSVYYNSAGIIHWDKIADAWSAVISKISPNACKQRWTRVREIYGGAKLTERSIRRWENLFIASYEKGETRKIESEEDFDLVAMAKFWKAKDGQLLEKKSAGLYKDFEDNTKEFVLQAQEVYDAYESVQNSNSMVRTEEFLTSFSFGYAKQNETSVPDEKSRAKQIIKGIVATNDSKYDASEGKEILGALGDEQVKVATDELIKQRTIVYVPRDREKIVPGRNFVFSERFLGCFQLKIGNTVFSEATALEDKLCQIIQSGKSMTISHAAPDSYLVSVLELICHRMVRLTRVNMVAGILVDGYRSRHIDKQKLDFDIVLGHSDLRDLTQLKRPEADVPLGTGPCAYMWTDVVGGLNNDIWEKTVHAVLWCIAMRPGVHIDILYHKWKVLLTEEELQVLLSYLCDIQVIRLGKENGYWAQERWYYSV